ncbi:MAG: hypothetical protein GTN81_12195 [Proteobacteria bacterium]|nr:hypothetical protein [Pseudomonadota bacterium]
MGVKILSEKNVIDDGFLDLIGREFSTHEQGLAEWLKNSLDATLRVGLTRGVQTIFLRFTDATRQSPPIFECIDFVGMTLEDLEGRFKPWGKLSRHSKRTGTYGGYGIGGKFYMRQMFDSSYLITYRQGVVNIFGFGPKHRYGYGQGYRNRPMDPREALRFANIEPLAALAGVRTEVMKGKRGFSVVHGRGPKGIGKKVDVERICLRLSGHPQAHRPLKVRRVCVIHNGAVAIERLNPRSITKKSGFERPWVRKIPTILPQTDKSMEGPIRLSPNSQSLGTLRLWVSNESLAKKGKMASLNRIDFVDRGGVMASYRIEELGADVPYGESIFGECSFSELEYRHGPFARKTRDRLIESPETKALLHWVSSQVIRFSQRISRQVRKLD